MAKEEMKRVLVQAYPYAHQYGHLDIPKGMKESEELEYIKQHFDEIRFGEPSLDYRGTDFDWEDDE